VAGYVPGITCEQKNLVESITINLAKLGVRPISRFLG